MASIQIAEEPHPKADFTMADTKLPETATKINTDDGIYNIRSRMGAASRNPSFDEDPGLRKSGDYKKKQVQKRLYQSFHGKLVLRKLGLQRQNALLARIPIDRCYLW